MDGKEETIGTKLTYIIPCYNAGIRLSKCVDSILQQGVSEFEIIIINDGSDEETSKIAEAQKSKSQNIIVINQENSGACVARNNGIDKATGYYIMFVDADDTLEPQSVGRLVRNAEDNALPDLVISGYNIIEGERKQTTMLAAHDYRQNDLRKAFLRLCDDLAFSSPWLKLYKKSVIKKKHIRFTDGMRDFEDYVFNCLVWEHINSVMTSDIVTYNYYMNSDSLSHVFCVDSLVSDFKQYVESGHRIVESLSHDKEELDYGKGCVNMAFAKILRAKVRLLYNTKSQNKINDLKTIVSLGKDLLGDAEFRKTYGSIGMTSKMEALLMKHLRMLDIAERCIHKAKKAAVRLFTQREARRTL